MTEEPTNTDRDADDSTSTPAELAARKAELEANLKLAVDDSVKVGFDFQSAHYLLRDLEWMSTALGHDVETWASIAVAVAELPADATMQQIALVQAKAIVASKQKIQSQTVEQLPVVREHVVAAARAYDEKEKAVEKAKDELRDLNPTKKFNKQAAAMAMSSVWLSGLFNKGFGKG